MRFEDGVVMKRRGVLEKRVRKRGKGGDLRSLDGRGSKLALSGIDALVAHATQALQLCWTL